MRYLALPLAVVCLAVLTTLGGCTPTEPDEQGRELTAEQWQARAERVKAQAEADAKAAADKLTRETARLQREAEAAAAEAQAKAAERKRAFDAAVVRLQSETGIKVAELASLYDAEQASAQLAHNRTLLTIAERAAEADAAAADRIATNAATIDAAASQTEAALASIAAKQERIAGLLAAGQTIASGFGPGGVAVSSLLGLGGALFGVSKARKAKQIEEASTRVVDAIDAVKLADPDIALAFKSHAKILSEWMGPAGVALVNKAQHS